MMISNYSRGLRLLAGPAAVLLAACGDATRPEHGGDYTASVVAPASHANGAAVIELAGSGVDTVTSVSGRVFVERLPGDYTRVVVVNDEPGRLQFRVRIARGSNMPRATLIEVADENDHLRTSLGGYSVSFAR